MKPLFLNWVHGNSHTPHEWQATLPQENLQTNQIWVNSMERTLGTKEQTAPSSVRPRAGCGHPQDQLLGRGTLSGSLAPSRLGNAVDTPLILVLPFLLSRGLSLPWRGSLRNVGPGLPVHLLFSGSRSIHKSQQYFYTLATNNQSSKL